MNGELKSQLANYNMLKIINCYSVNEIKIILARTSEKPSHPHFIFIEINYLVVIFTPICY